MNVSDNAVMAVALAIGLPAAALCYVAYSVRGIFADRAEAAAEQSRQETARARTDAAEQTARALYGRTPLPGARDPQSTEDEGNNP